MKILWILIFAQFTDLSTNAQTPPGKCCGNEDNLIVNSVCKPDKSGKSSPIPLTCDAKYVLDPSTFEDDEYNVTVNGSLLLYDFGGTIPAGE